MKTRIIVGLLAAGLLIFLAQSAPRTQSSEAKATLHGVVTDPSGAAIPGAFVSVSNGQFVRTLSTNETGQYAISGLLPGHYRVQIHSPGFSTFAKSGLVLSAGHETEGDAQLVIRTAKQEITVTD